MAGGSLGSELVVSAADVLHERVPGGQGPRGPVTLQAAHRPEPGLQPPVISLDRIVRVPLHGVQRGGDQLIEDPRIDRGPVGGDLGGDRAGAQGAGEEPPGCGQVTMVTVAVAKSGTILP